MLAHYGGAAGSSGKRNSWKKLAGITLASFMALGTLSACGTSAADTTEPVPTTTVTVTKTAPTETVTTTVTTEVTPTPTEETTTTEPVTDPANLDVDVNEDDGLRRGIVSLPDPVREVVPPPAPAPVPAAVPAPAPAPAATYYKNCTAVRAAGAAPIYAGSPGYASHLDRDGDGIGCE
ncbi:excalibur calcium-binding domain-containing protein [Corynebacterium sp. A21]|uniref:excalibur calcium-binding domain-containing protein n=1 Tax=Corynebacterium sp. A21 TaxID=3457318 RepID=UPI003FD1068E